MIQLIKLLIQLAEYSIKRRIKEDYESKRYYKATSVRNNVFVYLMKHLLMVIVNNQWLA